MEEYLRSILLNKKQPEEEQETTIGAKALNHNNVVSKEKLRKVNICGHNDQGLRMCYNTETVRKNK